MKVFPVVFISILILSGCASTPTGNVGAFGLAVSEATDQIDSIIDDYNTASINDRLVVMAQSTKKYVTSDFDPIKRRMIKNNNKDGIALHKANEALRLYAISLFELSNSGSREEMMMAGIRLSNSLSAMNEQYKALAETEKNLIKDDGRSMISRTIAQISTFYIEKKRATALKEIIIAANPSIQRIGAIMSEHLLKSTIEGRLYTMRGNELAGYFDDYNQKVKKLSFASRKKMLDKIYEIYVERESTSATIKQAQKAVLSIVTSHAKFKTELENNRFESKALVDAISNIATVHKGFNDLQILMEDCKTEVVSDEEKGIICKG